MYGKYRIVTITPLGRRKYIELLYPHLLANADIIDEHIFWVNTNDTYDISYAYSLVFKHKDFFTIKSNNLPSGISPKENIANMYLSCNDRNTIYIKINDDICWLDAAAIRKLIEFRINNPKYFLIHPLIMNTTKAMTLLQLAELIPFDLVDQSPVVIRKRQLSLGELNPKIAEYLHSYFLKWLKGDALQKLCDVYHKYVLFDYEYIPEHCVCWFGKDFQASSCLEQKYDKYWLSLIEPKQRGIKSCICYTSIMSHFAYNNQQNHLTSKTKIYDQYLAISKGLTKNAK